MTRTTTLWSLLLLSAALALGSCTKDATEQATGPEPEAKAASKLYCTPKVGHFWGVFYEI